MVMIKVICIITVMYRSVICCRAICGSLVAGRGASHGQQPMAQCVWQAGPHVIFGKDKDYCRMGHNHFG